MRGPMTIATEFDPDVRERTRLQPYAEALVAIIRRADPTVTYSLSPGPDRGIWLLDVYVRPPLDNDMDLHGAVTERAVDFQIHDGVSLAVIPHAHLAAAS